MNEGARIEAFISQFDRLDAPWGPGDDAAIVKRATAAGECVTTDAVVEGVHFTRETFSLEDVGHKALAVNLSDLAAMGATPRWAVCALGLPTSFAGPELRALGRGMAALARVHGVALVGGNVTASPVLSLTLTVAGALGPRPLLRSGARVGDEVLVSGPLGLASAGLEVLTAGATGFERLVQAQRRPVPHLAWARAAARFASAGLDVSDGLLQDLGHIARASRVAIDVSTAGLALHIELLRWAGSLAEARSHALSGGEDYVVAVTVPAERLAAFERSMTRAGFGAFAIGRVIAGAGVRLDGRRAPRQGGFQHASSGPRGA